MNEDLLKGIIKGFQGSWMSGLGALLIEDECGCVHSVHCDNAQTVRALEGAFGDVIGNAHDVNNEGGHIGKEIYYSVDAFGILEGFTPIAEASEELNERYNSQVGGEN